jgi:membrane-associated phospholipid phosphatase
LAAVTGEPLTDPRPRPDAPPERLRAAERLAERLRRAPTVRLDPLAVLDLHLLRILRTRGHTPAAERAVLAFSNTGEHAALWYAVAAAGFLLHRERRADYRAAAEAVFATQVANSAAKVTIRRARPALEGLPALSPTVSGLSHPSAHASTAFAAAAALAPALPSGPLHLAAVAMAASRPYLGVHYPSDVIVGGVLGAVIGRIFRRGRRT